MGNVTERVAIAEAMTARLQGRNHRPDKSGNNSLVTDQGQTRDIAAAKAGLGSGKTLEAGVSPIWGMKSYTLPCVGFFLPVLKSVSASGE